MILIPNNASKPQTAWTVFLPYRKSECGERGMGVRDKFMALGGKYRQEFALLNLPRKPKGRK